MNVFGVIAAVFGMYLAICIFRVLLTWFGPLNDNLLVRFVVAVSDPWMKPFAKIKFLKLRNLDFSPIVALIILQVVTQVLWQLAMNSNIWPGLVLALLLGRIAGAINFFLLFFIVLAAVRLVGILIRSSSVQTFWFALDHILQPMVYPLLARMFPRRVVPYGSGLILFMVLCGLLATGLHFGFSFLILLVDELGS